MSHDLPLGWQIVHERIVAGRNGEYQAPEGLGLSINAISLVQAVGAPGLYTHQWRAIALFGGGADVCMTTSTASGKTLAFQIAAIELLASNPTVRVLAIYPQKALGNEQQRRWTVALQQAGLDAAVGKIDGGVPVSARSAICEQARVLIATPDVLHAWLLSRLSDSPVRSFLAALGLVVVDEVHSYTGVLGSNAAFLFRRLEHAGRALGATPRYFAASATVRDPMNHAGSLLGRPVALVSQDWDTSPRYPLTLRLVRPPGSGDFLTEVSQLLKHVLSTSSSRFLVFVDSRKQTEQIAAITNRLAAKETGERDIEEDGESDDVLGGAGRDFRSYAVLPYRAGLEELDREAIERQLGSGELRGVVSTSALELGIDLPHINTGVLVGVPRSATSLLQRIGRIGRSAPGEVLVVHSGDYLDEEVFNNPEELLQRPPAEGALYLENRRIQYIHALCLARPGGEHDQVCPQGITDLVLKTDVDWPSGFLGLCEQERTGQIPPELQAMKAESGDDPNHVFPLRDVESQFKVTHRLGPIHESKGQLSFAQVMREAYPGALYYYIGKPFRVTRVSLTSRSVYLRLEKRYTTKPTSLPTMVFPNLQTDTVTCALKRGEMLLVETDLQISEAVAGYRERRGGTETVVAYPLEPASGISWRLPRFKRNYFTSGVVIRHPLFDDARVELDDVALLMLEALLMTAPYERSDIGCSADRFRATTGPFTKGERFVCIFDQTYGSLRLSGRLLLDDVLPKVTERMLSLANQVRPTPLRLATKNVIDRLVEGSLLSSVPLQVGGRVVLVQSAGRARVILPGSQGISSKFGNAHFAVDRVLVHPQMGLAYRGRHEDGAPGNAETVPATDILPVPGESLLGWYDFDSGELSSD